MVKPSAGEYAAAEFR